MVCCEVIVACKWWGFLLVIAVVNGCFVFVTAYGPIVGCP